MRIALAVVAALLCTGIGALAQIPNGSREQNTELKPLRGVTRILFLGDSITYSGGYVDLVDAWLRRHDPAHPREIMNIGLPSETVSGLTEPNHAGGAFPRPDLHERLGRALAKVKPDLVVACYGMNDGIYYPFAPDHFQKYQEGLRFLAARVKKVGARLWLLTPPPFDPLPIQSATLPAGQTEYPSGHPYAGYDDVLTQYGAWIVSQKRAGWQSTDIHAPIKAYVAERRKTEPNFAFAGDGVHLNEAGHRLIARAILTGWGARPETLPPLDASETPISPQNARFFALVQERQSLLKDAWLNDIGHKRPGMAQGILLPLAQQKAAELDAQLRQMASASPKK